MLVISSTPMLFLVDVYSAFGPMKLRKGITSDVIRRVNGDVTSKLCDCAVCVIGSGNESEYGQDVGHVIIDLKMNLGTPLSAYDACIRDIETTLVGVVNFSTFSL